MGESPCGPLLCIHDDGRAVELGIEAPYCHTCAVEFEMWFDELTDDRPCND